MFPQGRYPSTGIGGGVFAHRGLGAAAEVEARTARYGQNRFAAKVELETGILLTLFNAVLGLQQEGKAAAESALTGESLPVSKGTEAVADGDTPVGDRTDMVYMNTNVTRGSGVFVVTATGQFADTVVPLLQERGVFRTEYAGATLRDHLGLDDPGAAASRAA